MALARRGCAHAALAVAALLGACARLDGVVPGRTPGGLRLSIETRAEPGVFVREAPGRRDGPDGAPGLWAAVPDLPRPERGQVENLATGARATVALFRADRSVGVGEVRLSGEAADALGIAARPVRVRVTAVRTQLRVDSTSDGF